MSADEDGQQRLGAEPPDPKPPAGPYAEWPTNVYQLPGEHLSDETRAEPPAGSPGLPGQLAETVAPAAELSYQELRRLRARLVRKYH